MSHDKLIDILQNKIKDYNRQLYGELNIYGEENIDYINDKIYQKLAKYPTLGMLELFKLIHYNIKHQENINIFICRNDETKANIYMGDQWEKKDIDDILYPLICRLYKILNKDSNEKLVILGHRIDNKDANTITFYKNELISIMKNEKEKLMNN